MRGTRKGSFQTRFQVTEETRRLMEKISKDTGLGMIQVQQLSLGFGAAILHSGLAALKPTMEQQGVILAQMFPKMAESVAAITAETVASKRGRKPRQ
jgi:hypothetical protein